ncbi:MAG: GNAT family N-acetyltransferase [Rivularia sp. (in: cyanobacteria)]
MVQNQDLIFPLPEGFRIRRADFKDKLRLFFIESQFFAAENKCIVNIFQSLIMYILPLLIVSVILLIAISFSYLLEYIFAYILILLILSPMFTYVFRYFLSEVWVVECKRKIVAIAKLSKSHKSISLDSLGVLKSYRNQGIGSALVNYIVSLCSKPIDVSCKPDVVLFYSRFGFRIKPKYSLFLFAINPSIVEMLRNELPPALIKDDYDNAYTISKSTKEYRVYKASKQDIKKLRNFLSNHPQLNFFVSFNNHFYLLSTTLFLLGTVLGLLNINLITLLILNLYFYWQTAIINWINIFIILSLVLMFLLRILIIYFNISQSQFISKLWLFEYNDKLIGYAKLSDYRQYSVLQNLSLIVYTKSFKSNLLQQLVSQLDKTIYFACENYQTGFYLSLGFTKIEINDLPKRLRIGGRINILCGGSNLVYLR